jgi:hypothetical protein
VDAGGREPGSSFPEILEPLEPFRSQLNVVSGLRHALAYGSGATANHNRSAAAFLSGAFAKTGAQPYLGVTDRPGRGAAIGQDTPLPSLELMIEGASLNCGDGLSCSYRDTISWQSPTSPLPMQNNPQVVFEKLFGDGSTMNAERDARRQQSLSLLDSVAARRGAAARLPAERSQPPGPVPDRRPRDRAPHSARPASSSPTTSTCPPAPTGVPRDVEEHIKLLMYDLQVLAWQADITRVSTLLLAKELSNTVYPNSGVRDAFHTLSHHSNIQENKDRFAVLNRYHVGLFAVLPREAARHARRRRHAARPCDRALRQRHERRQPAQPHRSADRAGRRRVGKLKGGRHIRNPKDTPMANLLVAMLTSSATAPAASISEAALRGLGAAVRSVGADLQVGPRGVRCSPTRRVPASASADEVVRICRIQQER